MFLLEISLIRLSSPWQYARSLERLDPDGKSKNIKLALLKHVQIICVIGERNG